ncbi:inorganic phosphate transporter [Paracoccus albus]|uniref:inorganic phosphate transporter n=1 Tax=Paracoccus albus TaxID=3017784 RepID=UPI0022EFFD81|nr:inorganic phosphate transporter [Paracoccus albus]WBU60230.1 inorganic phosphate transporter [Paracoccus albus]
MPTKNDYRILDKDLTRLGHAEGAGRIASRPLRRIGLVLAILLLAVLLAVVGGTGLPVSASVVLGFSVAIYLGLNIGANDVANSAGAAIGANAMPVGLGLAAVALAQLAGAHVAGHSVTETIARDILEISAVGTGATSARIMAAALIGAALWITFANWARAPVSTTHSVIGAVSGGGMAGLGLAAVNWPVVAGIAISWIAAPVISALFAAALLGFLRWRVHFAPDRAAAARVWLPVMIGSTAAVFATYLIILIQENPPSYLELVLCALLGLAAGIAARLQLEGEIKNGADHKLTLKRLLTGPLVITALLSGFAHGANDVANIAGPLSVLLASTESAPLSGWAVGLAALSISAGSFIFGRRLVQMVGMSITRLNPARAFCAALAAASTVLACSALGLPVSTTHCAVGGIFGVGFYREWEDRLRRKTRKSLPEEEVVRRQLVRRSHVWTTLAAWAVTVPGAGCVAAVTYALISLVI